MTTKSIFSKRLRNSNSLRFGNSVFSIEFEQNTSFPVFGCRYKFFLEDAIYSLPEYLVHFPTFVRYALPLCTLPLPFSIALSLPLPLHHLPRIQISRRIWIGVDFKREIPRFLSTKYPSLHSFLFFLFSFFLFFYFSISSFFFLIPSSFFL